MKNLSRKTTHRVENVLAYCILLVFFVVTLFPIFWTVMTSFKNATEAFLIPPVWIFQPTLDNYAAVFSRRPFLNYMFNSFVASSGATALSVVFGTLAGYSFARFRFRGKTALFFGVLVTRMIPAIAVMIPLFVQFWNLGLLDTYLALVLVYTSRCIGYASWMMHGVFQTIPRDLEESAMVDGCSRLGALVRIVIPVAAAGLVSFVVLNYIYLWNEFLIAAIVTGRDTKTLPVAMTGFMAERRLEWGPANAAASVVMLPMLILAFVFSKYIVKGMIMGAVKG